jgi:hypothetical protein
MDVSNSASPVFQTKRKGQSGCLGYVWLLNGAFIKQKALDPQLLKMAIKSGLKMACILP